MNARAKAIVREAWEITTHEKKLLKFGFWPSFFGLLVGGAYLFYQIDAFGRSKLFYKTTFIDFSALFKQILSLMSSNTWLFVGLIILIILIVLAYVVVPIVCSGALVHMISRIHKKEETQHGLSVGIFRFLPIFEASAVKNSLKPVAFFTEWSFVIRNVGRAQASLILPILLFFTFIGGILLFIFAFTTQFIVIEKNNFIPSIVKSTKLAIQNMSTTFSLFLIIILIELRVILNVAVILLIPLAIFWITGLFSTVFNVMSIVSAGVVVLTLVSITAYVTGTLSVFAHAIWTIAYHDFQGNLEE